MRIDKFLRFVGEKVDDGKLVIIPTEKNKVSRRKYGLTIEAIEMFIKSINAGDLWDGPVIDINYPTEEIYIFKKEPIPGVLFYVKLKLKNQEAICLSCHEDE